jgi:hypothetical protein
MLTGTFLSNVLIGSFFFVFVECFLVSLSWNFLLPFRIWMLLSWILFLSYRIWIGFCFCPPGFECFWVFLNWILFLSSRIWMLSVRFSYWLLDLNAFGLDFLTVFTDWNIFELNFVLAFPDLNAFECFWIELCSVLADLNIFECYWLDFLTVFSDLNWILFLCPPGFECFRVFT